MESTFEKFNRPVSDISYEGGRLNSIGLFFTASFTNRVSTLGPKINVDISKEHKAIRLSKATDDSRCFNFNHTGHNSNILIRGTGLPNGRYYFKEETEEGFVLVFKD